LPNRPIIAGPGDGGQQLITILWPKMARNPATEFAAFFAAKRERRSNADPDFDADVFDEAARLIVHKLEALNARGFNDYHPPSRKTFSNMLSSSSAISRLPA
jgi:hypothetical protein